MPLLPSRLRKSFDDPFSSPCESICFAGVLMLSDFSGGLSLLPECRPFLEGRYGRLGTTPCCTCHVVTTDEAPRLPASFRFTISSSRPEPRLLLSITPS